MNTWTITHTTRSYKFLQHSLITYLLQNRYQMPSDFCSYYTKVAKMMLLSFILFFFLACAPIATLWLCINPHDFFNSNPYGIPFTIILGLGTISSALLVGGIVGTGLVLLIEYILTIRPTPKLKSKPSLIKTWINAKKNKYCPIIEYDIKDNNE